MGIILADFHIYGMVFVLIVMLKRLVRCLWLWVLSVRGV